jgi:hypothetical protein
LVRIETAYFTLHGRRDRRGIAVSADHEQHKTNRAKHQPERAPHVAEKLFAQR